jgi:hypothetical protein
MVYIVLGDALWRNAVSPILSTSESIIHTSAELTQ